MAQTLKTPEMAVYDPRPIRLIAIQKRTQNQTEVSGVWVTELILVQTQENGNRRSREKAKTVRAVACKAVKQTNLMMMNPERVKKIPPALPRES